MLQPVRPSLNFWYYLGIISSPAWVFSFLAMDFVKKRTGLVAVLLIFTLVITGFISNFALSKHYFGLRKFRRNACFFCGYERAGKTTGYVLVFFGNIGLYYYSEKSVACILTFLFLALYCFSTLLCIQPYTDFGVLEFLLSASMNQALSLLGIRSYWSWLVIIGCIGIGGMRYCLEPVHPPGEGTRDQLPTFVQPPATYETVVLAFTPFFPGEGSRDEVVQQLPTSEQPPATYETTKSSPHVTRVPFEASSPMVVSIKTLPATSLAVIEFF
ncbi:hypothetical protein RHSIM_Rhsim01G0214000 [Rhododendron simsii]|uniref:Transmembrane protein n=1 Tax=Rhododendron simsii TaxID=118357 RepID=A0A834HH53_RHOSS|nr:hypothetical protein RHSIM_Rhsim01G0214000 [Rhododendron simsii]